MIFSCDFDDDAQFEGSEFCGFEQSTADDHDWERGAITPSSNTGPMNGDASGSGEYLLLKESLKYS